MLALVLRERVPRETVGVRRTWIEPDTDVIPVGETVAVHFSFECVKPGFTNEVYASLVVDTGAAVITEQVTSSGAELVVTHKVDSEIAARGWTMSGFETGDTAHLVATVTFPRRMEGSIMHVMEKASGGTPSRRRIRVE